MAMTEAELKENGKVLHADMKEVFDLLELFKELKPNE